MKFKIATLGCRTNQYESAAYHTQLKKSGFSKADEGEQADICIVNTCTVTENAQKDSERTVRRLLKENPQAKVIVTGCAAEKNREVFMKMGAFNVVANESKEELLPLVFPEQEFPEFAINHFEAHTRAFVKVQDGCNSYCTYCIIPYVRGRSRSRKNAEILQEIRTLIQNGYKEVVLTGINIGDFEGSLADLVREVDMIEGLERLRLSSIDPDEVGDDLLNALLEGRTTCPSLHLVLQSGSNVILKRMNRKYTRQIFMDTVERIRKRAPDFTFTTDVIVGFPGETETDFQETVAVVSDVMFAKVHIFPYSPRARTRAALYPNQVPQEVIKERKQLLARHVEAASFQLRQKYLNKNLWVLTEGDGQGHSANFLPVIVEGLAPNQLAEVRIIENRPDSLVGVPLCA